eukprot:scaffold3309_cov19-Tisochrysis_lutea.AAC.1
MKQTIAPPRAAAGIAELLPFSACAIRSLSACASCILQVRPNKPYAGKVVVSEIAPAGDYWIAEDYHQQGGRFGAGQSAAKGEALEQVALPECRNATHAISCATSYMHGVG